ncbi:MAG: precorrin-6Y C5,15-methyltransferase (decarboxylating) subunit CbiT [Euryarchaeota archaeon]|nr:precorrin-6Y C5,15-methyltransferase (decarboxylating) subunit CbiT [Euryarchaeota archaeon]
MTKREVRMLALCMLAPERGQVAYDIGAGTGSVSVELALLGARVYAVEKRREAVELVQRNLRRFGARAEVVHGEAPEALLSLPPPDRVFIGGSGGRIAEIVEHLSGVMKPGGRVVATAVTLSTLERARRAFEANRYSTEVVLASFARLQNGRLSALNPVFVIAASR